MSCRQKPGCRSAVGSPAPGIARHWQGFCILSQHSRALIHRSTVQSRVTLDSLLQATELLPTHRPTAAVLDSNTGSERASLTWSGLEQWRFRTGKGTGGPNLVRPKVEVIPDFRIQNPQSLPCPQRTKKNVLVHSLQGPKSLPTQLSTSD